MIEIAAATCCGLAMTTGEIPGFESRRLRTKNRLPEYLVAPPTHFYANFLLLNPVKGSISVISGAPSAAQRPIQFVLLLVRIRLHRGPERDFRVC